MAKRSSVRPALALPTPPNNPRASIAPAIFTTSRLLLLASSALALTARLLRGAHDTRAPEQDDFRSFTAKAAGVAITAADPATAMAAISATRRSRMRFLIQNCTERSNFSIVLDRMEQWRPNSNYNAAFDDALELCYEGDRHRTGDTIGAMKNVVHYSISLSHHKGGNRELLSKSCHL